MSRAAIMGQTLLRPATTPPQRDLHYWPQSDPRPGDRALCGFLFPGRLLPRAGRDRCSTCLRLAKGMPDGVGIMEGK